MPGLYCSRDQDLDSAAKGKPSGRGGREITSVKQAYLDRGQVHVETSNRGYAWLDTGTHDSLLEASEFVRTLQNRQGLQVACLEEIAYLQKFITREQLIARGELFAQTNYGNNLLRPARE